MLPPFVSYTYMKRVLLRAISSVTRSDFSARGEALRAESRAEVARQVTNGKAWEGMQTNAALLGIKSGADSRPKMVFGARR